MSLQDAIYSKLNLKSMSLQDAIYSKLSSSQCPYRMQSTRSYPGHGTKTDRASPRWHRIELVWCYCDSVKGSPFAYILRIYLFSAHAIQLGS